MADFPIRKNANLFFPGESRLDPTVSWLANYETRGLMRGMLKFSDGLLGGGWVGGTATLYADRLIFVPNSLNQVILADAPGLKISLTDVETVGVTSGILSNIIELDCRDNKRFRLRCWGAASFAACIEDARQGRDC